MVITLQFSYTQETIYNALLKMAMLKITLPTVNVLTALSRSIHYTALQTERRETCHANVALLSSVHVFMWLVCHLAFQLLCCPEKIEEKKKQKTCQSINSHYLSLSVKKIMCCFLYTWKCLTLSCNCIRYCYWQIVV